jgi:hypothetical protein
MLNYQTEEIHQTIPKFLNFLILKIQNHIPITYDERYKTWECYVEYCKENDLDHINRHAFYKVLKEGGITSELLWNMDMKRMQRVRDLNLMKLQRALGKWVDNSCAVSSLLEIGGVKYQVITKLIKLNPLSATSDKKDSKSK